MANSVSRACTWDDVLKLHALNLQAASDVALAAGSHIGEFYWALRATPNDDIFRSMRVWARSDGSLAAAAWLDGPDTGDYIVVSEEEQVIDDAFDWLEREARAAGAAALSVMAREPDTVRTDALRRRRYSRSDAGNIRLARRLDGAPPATRLPDGFTLRHVGTGSDLERRAFVESTSFGVMTVSAARWRELARRLPNYNPALDLIVITPGGAGASACTCWYDEKTRRGEIEAVGTSRAFQRMGLGKAVITEGLRRLAELGATEAVLYTSIGNVASSALYRSCGFEIVGEDFAWTKRL